MKFSKFGVTLLELIVVVLIISILSTISVAVYTGQVEKARIAAAKTTISQMESACHVYQTDVGQFPPSGTFGAPIVGAPVWGCGYMTLALLHSVNGNALNPADKRWNGPYLELDNKNLGNRDGVPLASITSSINKAEINILDPWGMPYQYVRFDNYSVYKAAELPTTSPFFATETHYNVSTFQIYSYGPNTITAGASGDAGLDTDDITNFNY